MLLTTNDNGGSKADDDKHHDAAEIMRKKTNDVRCINLEAMNGDKGREESNSSSGEDHCSVYETVVV